MGVLLSSWRTWRQYSRSAAPPSTALTLLLATSSSSSSSSSSCSSTRVIVVRRDGGVAAGSRIAGTTRLRVVVVQAWKAWRAWVGNSGEHPLVATLVSGLIVSQEAPRFSSFALSPSNPANTPFAPIFPSLASLFARVCNDDVPFASAPLFPVPPFGDITPPRSNNPPAYPTATVEVASATRRSVQQVSAAVPLTCPPTNSLLVSSLLFFPYRASLLFSRLSTQRRPSNPPPTGCTAFQVLLRREIRGRG